MGSKSLSRAVTRYKAKHYKIIWVRREFHDKIRDAARKAGCSVPELVYKLFNRYGGKLVEELLAERSKSAQRIETPPEGVEAPKVKATTPKPRVEIPEPGFVIVDLGAHGRFKVREADWRRFAEIVESTHDPVTAGVLAKLPPHLRDLFRSMRRAMAVRYDVKAGTWVIDYSRFRIVRAR
jgi:hypothetical protein